MLFAHISYLSLCVFFFRLFSSSCSRPGFDFQFSAVVRGEIHLKKKEMNGTTLCVDEREERKKRVQLCT